MQVRVPTRNRERAKAAHPAAHRGRGRRRTCRTPPRWTAWSRGRCGRQPDRHPARRFPAQPRGAAAQDRRGLPAPPRAAPAARQRSGGRSRGAQPLPALQRRSRATGPGRAERRLPDHDPATVGDLRTRGRVPQPVCAPRAAAAAGRCWRAPARASSRCTWMTSRGRSSVQPGRSAHVRAALRAVRADACTRCGSWWSTSVRAAGLHRPVIGLERVAVDAAGGGPRAPARHDS